MLHFSGGATNPFIFYYFFHTLLASILLSKTAAYIESAASAALFSTMSILEGNGIIPHYTLFGPVSHTDPVFISGICFAMTSALIIAVYMANSIMDRLRQHQTELERALEETARLEAEKSRFLDVVAHDLKSPLASIETMASSNLAVFGDELPPQVKQTLERIPVRTKQLLQLIQELLDFSRITQLTDVQLEFKQLHFLPIVTATVEMYMTDALEKNITVTLNADPDLPPVMGNKNHLERMVGNLISNAIRYTPTNGSVKVKVTSQNGSLVLTVADTGIGIPEESISSIFTNFYRAKNARKMDSSGTGLGLSITKAIAEKHRGTISFTSTEGEGTVFTVTLPAATH
jgi:signal transduction histidine kinase